MNTALAPQGTIPQPAGITMSSREIAELTGKRHDNVKRTIETLINQRVIDSPQIEDEQKTDAMGRPRATQIYIFTGEQGKRDSIVVVAQLSPEFTARLVDRWQELELKAATGQFAIPQTLSEALRLAADLSDKALQLEAVIEEQKPRVQALHRIASADGSLCMRDAAKVLQIRPVDLKNLMLYKKWIYGRPGHTGYLAYQDKLQTGLLTHKVHTATREDGTEKVVEQVRITGKGMAHLGEMLMQKAA